jgi:hypothetical protein
MKIEDLKKVHKRTLAKMFGSKTGKLKKKHLVRAKFKVRNSTTDFSRITVEELAILGV